MPITPTLFLIAITALSSIPHIRATDPIVLDALSAGYRHSPTFRRLVETLDRSDVIVHVERRQRRVSSDGAINFVTHAGMYRYLRITLADGLSPDGVVSLLAHELQHASEVAEAAWVVDDASYLELYRTIGHTSCTGRRWCFDTVGAIDAGRRVLWELRHARTASTD